ncbi:MAG: TMEM175 family protein [Acidimicrobiia bacterium]|jgi:uncharacterized membrane protein
MTHDRGDRARPRYERESHGLEFDRVAFFSDAVFAIAMTLLVVGIGIPTVSDGELGDALRDKQPEIISFFISFVVIGNYWLGHHRFFSRLRAVSARLMTLNLVYLAAIAFVPFPTALAGKYTEEPVSIVMYAITLSVASGLEAVMFVVAHREGLFRTAIPRDVVRFTVVATVIPVVVFLGSIPVAFVSTTTALYTWLLIFPLEYLVDVALKPDDIDDVLA